jgi:hypothetical protein
MLLFSRCPCRSVVSGPRQALQRPGRPSGYSAHKGAGDEAAEGGGDAEEGRLRAGREHAFEVAAEAGRLAAIAASRTMAGTDSPIPRGDPCAVACLAWIICLRLLGSASAYGDEDKDGGVAASSAERTVLVVQRWFIRVPDRKNGAPGGSAEVFESPAWLAMQLMGAGFCTGCRFRRLR